MLTIRFNRNTIGLSKMRRELRSLYKAPENFRVTLRTAREISKLTQVKAAQLLGISADTLRSYEKGDSYPDVPMIGKIERLYGFGYNQLIFLPYGYGLTEVKKFIR